MDEVNEVLISEYKGDLNLAPRSRDSYIYILTRLASDHLGMKSLTRVTPQDIIDWFRGRNWSSSYRGVIWATVKSFAKWAHMRGLMKLEAMDTLGKYGFRRSKGADIGHITTDRMWDVIRSASTSRARIICVLLFGTGCRRSALSALRWYDFDLHQHRLMLRGEITKGHKRRSVGLMPWVEKELMRYRDSLDTPPGPNDFLFPSPRLVGKHITGSVVYWDFRKSVERAGGIPKELAHPHIARHTFAVAVLESQKVNLRKLQHTLGHESLQTTAKYLKVVDVECEQAIRGAIESPPDL